MRPATIIACIIIAGTLAALPFHRPPETRHSDPQGYLTGPAERPGSGWTANDPAAGADAPDHSPAWQPVPMAAWDSPTIDPPAMPDSYYDVSWDWEQPEVIRQRFTAVAVQPPAGDRAADESSASSDEVTQQASVKELRSWANQAPPQSHQEAIQEAVRDRFVFTPIEADQQNRLRRDEPAGSTAARPAATSRAGSPKIVASEAEDAGGEPHQAKPQPRYFIREP